MKNRKITQRQAVIKLVEKKDKDKRFIKNWGPVSLLNVDYKIIPKVFSATLKKVPPFLILSQQTAYVANRSGPFRRSMLSHAHAPTNTKKRLEVW